MPSLIWDDKIIILLFDGEKQINCAKKEYLYTEVLILILFVLFKSNNMYLEQI